MTNTKFNVILIAIGISLLIVLFNVFYLYRRNEASKINFNDKYIKDTVIPIIEFTIPSATLEVYGVSPWFFTGFLTACK